MANAFVCDRILLAIFFIWKGFTVDGEHGDTFEIDSFVNKCVEVVGQGYSEDVAIEGFVMKDMAVRSCG